MSDNQKIVWKVLSRLGCQTSKQISTCAFNWFGAKISTSAVSGAIRSFAARGWIGSSDCGYGANVYWLTDEGKRQNFSDEVEN